MTNRSMALALLVALFAAVATADVPLCTYAELGSITTNKNRTRCAKDTGADLSTLTGTPTDAEMDPICESEYCISLINAILELDPEDCTLPANENLQLMSEFVDPVVAYCSAKGVVFITSDGSNSTSSGSSVNVGDDDSSSASGSGSVGSSSTDGASRSIVMGVCALFTVVVAVVLAL